MSNATPSEKQPAAVSPATQASPAAPGARRNPGVGPRAVQVLTAGPEDAAAAAGKPAGSRTDGEVEILVRAHLPLVGHLVRELLSRVPAHVDRSDLMSAGSAALVAAARGFDGSRGVPFARFAATRVRGALLDELRSLDWASRSVRGKARAVEAAREELTRQLGRTPTTEELAATMNMSTDAVSGVAEDVQRAVVLSLQGFTTGSVEDMVAERTPGPEELLITRERLGYLRDAVAVLPERLQAVVQQYFFEERPMAEIATELGVTESRVSQLRAEALVLLRDGLNAQLDPSQVDTGSRPSGCAARRRHAYYSQIAVRGTVRSRLDATTAWGLPVPSAS